MRPRHGIAIVFVLAILAGTRLWNTHRGDHSAAAPRVLPAAVTHAGADVPVPTSCVPQVNQQLSSLLASGQQSAVDNVMVCGTTISPSRTQQGGPHGNHQILPLLVSLPGEGTRLVEVVTNDDLDGVATAPKGALVYAYGQAFFPSGGRFAAGVHDVHCSTHRGANNGWVVVNGVRSPSSCGAAP